MREVQILQASSFVLLRRRSDRIDDVSFSRIDQRCDGGADLGSCLFFRSTVCFRVFYAIEDRRRCDCSLEGEDVDSIDVADSIGDDVTDVSLLSINDAKADLASSFVSKTFREFIYKGRRRWIIGS